MKKPFSAWREGAPIYVSLLLIGLIAGWAGSSTPIGYWSWLALVPGVFALNFFRDPVREIPPGAGDIVSPADGKVVEIVHLDDSPFFEGRCLRISIFLNVFNVHVNRIPAEATVLRTERQAGVYHNAMKPESSDANVANTIWLDTPHGAMTVRQITGAVARRIVSRVNPGDSVRKGEKFGMIKFGSRTELYLTPEAEALVSTGTAVKGGSTILARIL